VKANHYRQFQLDGLELRAEGDTVDWSRIVPFDEVATITERDERGEVVTFRERFLPGCTTYVRQQAASRGGPTWIGLNLEHDGRLAARIGFATGLEERADGAYATFKLYDGGELAKVRSMLSTSHRGLSVEFSDRRDPVLEDGVTCRRQVYIGGVAATPVPWSVLCGPRMAPRTSARPTSTP
jgi:hypothetical protein